MRVPVSVIDSLYKDALDLLNQKRCVEAIDIIKDGLALQPDDPAQYKASNREGCLYYLLGLAMNGIGDTISAERHFQQSIDLFPGNCFAYDELLKLYRFDFVKNIRLRWHALRNYPAIVHTRYRWNMYASDAWDEYRKNNSATL